MSYWSTHFFMCLRCKFARSVGENSHVMWDTRSPVDARQSEPPRFGNPYPPRVSHIMSEHPPMTHANLQLVTVTDIKKPR
jgi:hypothetical protein